MEMQDNPTERFTDRAQFYARWRPGYPAALGEFFKGDLGLNSEDAVADVGAGTGLLSRVLLKVAGLVFAIEPNSAMRAIAENELGEHPGFLPIPGTAEATGLPDHSVKLVAAGQAFHWFDRPKAKVEFARILEPGGSAALVWNDRRCIGHAFGDAYDRLLADFRNDSRAGRRGRLNVAEQQQLTDFFAPHGFQVAAFENHQSLDLQGLTGQVLSMSSIPLPGEARHEELIGRINQIFAVHQVGGIVSIVYDTRVYFGKL
jgi:SAM-dependent methyltransferase